MKETPIIIDLNDKSLNERIFSQFAADMRSIMFKLFSAGLDVPLTVKGTQAQIDSFFKALKGEKRYMDSYLKYGLGDNRTLSNQHSLMTAVTGFENETGLRWPFKN
tara:strand:+ start:146 stop:463 length:318 start_codon:yes stop_codon:yes gene_type:complete